MEAPDRLTNAGTRLCPHHLLLLLLLIAAAASARTTRHGDGTTPRVPSNCHFPSDTSLKCHDRSLRDLSVPAAVTELALDGVPGDALDAANLRSLTWKRSEVASVKQIGNPGRLTFLELSGNNVTGMKNYEFQEFVSLKVMNLSFNVIDDLPRNVFMKLDLEKLCISHNLLPAIPFQVR